MKKHFLSALLIAGMAAMISSCTKDDNSLAVRSYTVPTTYTFSNANYTKPAQRARMAIELDTYLKQANVGMNLITLDPVKITNMYNNINSPFAEAGLNTAGINLRDVTSDAALIKSYADSVHMFNTGAQATPGKGGFVARGTNKIIVGGTGLEYGQGYIKGIMGALFLKEAVRLLTAVKTLPATDTAAAQAAWDEAFGYLAVPANYDSAAVYAATDPNRPLVWGGYLAERGRPIQAGGTIFNAFLKGRAAIGGYDVAVRNAQADIIIAKWEQLAARSAWVYVTMPTASSSVGNYGTQLHALSEAFGFIYSLKYRPADSKLSAANFDILNTIIRKDFYALVSQTGFTDLVTAQNILKTTYGLTD